MSAIPLVPRLYREGFAVEQIRDRTVIGGSQRGDLLGRPIHQDVLDMFDSKSHNTFILRPLALVVAPEPRRGAVLPQGGLSAPQAVPVGCPRSGFVRLSVAARGVLLPAQRARVQGGEPELRENVQLVVVDPRPHSVRPQAPVLAPPLHGAHRASEQTGGGLGLEPPVERPDLVIPLACQVAYRPTRHDGSRVTTAYVRVALAAKALAPRLRHVRPHRARPAPPARRDTRRLLIPRSRVRTPVGPPLKSQVRRRFGAWPVFV